MFGEDTSESPRQPSPWLALSPSLSSNSPSPHLRPASTSPQIDPLDLNAALGAFSDKLSQSLSSSFSSLSLAPAGDDDDGIGVGRRRSSGVVGAEGIVMPRLVPEVEEGNIEYKLKLIAPTPDRFARLVTQLKWRLLEGGGQAIYEIGVADSGQLVGLTQTELEESLETLERMADELGATVLISRAIEVPVLMGRIEGAGRVRAVQSPSPSAAAGTDNMKLQMKRQGKYNHPLGREWESGTTGSNISLLSEKAAIGPGNKRDRKLAIKLKKRETLAGSHPGPRPASVPIPGTGAVGQRSPLSDSATLPDEDSASSGSDTASTASAVSNAQPSSAALTITSNQTVESLPARTKARQISQPRGDPLLKAMAKRMKRDAVRERGKGLLVPPFGPQTSVGGGVGFTVARMKGVKAEGAVDSGLAAPAMPLAPIGMSLTSRIGGEDSKKCELTDQKAINPPYDQEWNGPTENDNADDDTDSDEHEQTRWIVEVQVLRKMDADAGEGFLDFEGFGLE